MENNRKECWYSVIRYSPNNLTGEIVNVGLILHSLDGRHNIKYVTLDENSNKLRSIINNKVDATVYKSYKDILDYYLSKCNESISGHVGELSICSAYEGNFLVKLYQNYLNSKLSLTKPKIAFTDDIDKLLNSLVRTYIGSQYLKVESTTVGVKKHVREIFEQKNLIGRKIKTDIEFNPIRVFDDIKVKLDFGFKNGVWNYLETIPTLRSPSEKTEWFAKTRFTIETLKSTQEDYKLQLIYKASDFKESITPMFEYLKIDGEPITGLNIEDDNVVVKLCDYIEERAQDIDEYIAS